MAFIFDPSKGETPASLRKKREIAEALKSNAMGMASSPGEGLAMIGAAIGSRIADGKANKAAAYGQQQASSAMAPIIAALGGGSPAPSSSSPAPTPATPQTAPQPSGQGAGYIREGLIKRGLPDHVADAFVANFKDESGLNPGINEAKPLVPGSRGGYGLYQLTGPRRVAYEKFAQQRGIPLDSTDAQLDFLMTEMQGPEARAAKNILSAPDTASAAQAIVRDFLRPAPEHRNRRMSQYASLGDSSPAAEAATAMAQGGQGMPQATPQMAPQPTPGGGGAMDVWQGRAQQGTASDGSQLVRTPDGVKRTSTKGYSEIIRPEGPPSERAPMPMRGQGGGIGAIISSLLGRGQSQSAPQMAPQGMPQTMPQVQQPVADPAAYNASVVRMSPDLAGPARQPVPQGQPPIPGIQPSAPTMQDMAGRMPAPQGQQIPQGMDALRTALQPQQVAPQPAPAQQAPVAAPQAQPAPQTAQVPAGGIALPQLLQIAQNPWVAENKLYGGIINTLIENQLNMNKPMNPMEKAQLEKLLIETEQLRNPVAKPTATMTEYDVYAEQEKAAGRQPLGIFEYQQALKKSGADNITVGGGNSDRRKKFEEATGTSWQKIVDQGTKSSSMMQDMQFLDELIEMAPQGPVQGRLAEMFPGFSSAGAAFNAIVKRVAPTMRAEGSGSTSDIEYDGMLKSLAALQNYPEANRLIVGMMKAKAQVDMDRASIVNAWSVGDLTDQEATKKMQELQSKSIMSPELKRLMIGLQPDASDGGVDDLVDKWSK